MDVSKSLEPLDFRSRPLASHAVSWSCDAELAIAGEDAIQIYLPEWPHSSRNDGDEATDDDVAHQQFSTLLTACGILKPDPAINARLCAFAGVQMPASNEDSETFVFRGVGSRPINRSGGTVAQCIRVEWSPNGLGHHSRPILAVLTTSGAIVALGEVADHKATGFLGSRTRTFKNWKMLWGLGANLPIPDGDSEEGFRAMDERIVSFAWSNEVETGRGLLAHLNDAGEVAVTCVQYYSRISGDAQDEEGWEIFEVGRFNGRGCHSPRVAIDADFVPSGSAFALRWSPWYVTGTSRTALLAYIAENHVGFRRVTVAEEWHRGQDPVVQVEEVDMASICTFLSTDAFLQWEDIIWEEGESRMVRGIIATPLVIKPFQVDLNAPPAAAKPPHSTENCETMYPKAGEQSTNPITGLVIHRPDGGKPAEPLYSFVRQSATSSNQDWYETNLPPSTPVPQWAEQIRKTLARQVPRIAVLAGRVDSESESDSELDDINDMIIDDPERPVSRVHPHRVRIWGIAASPGDGCTAVVVSKHSTQHSDRRGRSRVLFSWNDEEKDAETAGVEDLTTEGRVWESMYGLLKGTDIRATPTHVEGNPLRDLFKSVVPVQKCVFCSSTMTTVGIEATCEKGHSFATCTATGLAIMAPGVSRACSVCGLRCLNVSELTRIAKAHLGPEATVESAGEVCGGCGGKFLA